jgi:hypothetical protein
VDDRVELVGESGVEVVRDALGLRSIDDADRALPTDSAEVGRQQQESRSLAQVEELLPATGERAAQALALGGATPVRRGRDCARIARDTDEERLGSVALSDQLARCSASLLPRSGAS